MVRDDEEIERAVELRMDLAAAGQPPETGEILALLRQQKQAPRLLDPARAEDARFIPRAGGSPRSDSQKLLRATCRGSLACCSDWLS